MTLPSRPWPLFVLLFALLPLPVSAQVDEDQAGAWYMYFWNTRFGDGPWGAQGDIQYRNWDAIGDLEQLLLRGGLTYSPESHGVTFTLGYGNITSGTFGPGDETSGEDRLYQEATLPQSLGPRVNLRHRFRFEQRWVDGQDTRTRYRYALFMDVPLSDEVIGQGTTYLALYNELFINGQRDIGPGRTVEHFDRNRTYAALGYGIAQRLRVQIGYMRQTTDSLKKGQLQVSLHQTF